MPIAIPEIVAAALLMAGTLQLLWLAGHLAAGRRYRHLATFFLCVALAGLTLRMGKSSLNAFTDLPAWSRNLGLAGMIAVPPALFGHWIALRDGRVSAAAIAGLAIAVAFAALSPLIPNAAGDALSRAVYAGILAWGFAFGVAGGGSGQGHATRWIRGGAGVLLVLWSGFLLVFVAGSALVYVAWCALLAAASTALIVLWTADHRLADEYARLLRAGDADSIARAHALLQRLRESGTFRDANLTQARFARRIGMSAKQVSTLLALLPPHHFRAHLNDVRIAAAQDALRAGWDRPLTELAFHVGYNSSAAFSRAFKTTTGVSPSEWRQGTQPVAD